MISSILTVAIEEEVGRFFLLTGVKASGLRPITIWDCAGAIVAEKAPKIHEFDFHPGRILSGKYEVLERLGQGWEGEVYLIREVDTKIDRTAKFFYPERNPRNRTAIQYARKLNKLRRCPMINQYYTKENMSFAGHPITYLVSEFVEGMILTDFLKEQPGKRLSAFQALHLLHQLASGLAIIHSFNEYHGDIHTGNIVVERFGLSFHLKFLDLAVRKNTTRENKLDDIVDVIKVFYDSLGGAATYKKQPRVVKYICAGLKTSLICERFKTAIQLRDHLETMEWED